MQPAMSAPALQDTQSAEPLLVSEWVTPGSGQLGCTSGRPSACTWPGPCLSSTPRQGLAGGATLPPLSAECRAMAEPFAGIGPVPNDDAGDDGKDDGDDSNQGRGPNPVHSDLSSLHTVTGSPCDRPGGEPCGSHATPEKGPRKLPQDRAGGKATPGPVPRPRRPHSLLHRFMTSWETAPWSHPTSCGLPLGGRGGWGGVGGASAAFSCCCGVQGGASSRQGPAGRLGPGPVEVTDGHSPRRAGSLGWRLCAGDQGHGDSIRPAPGLRSQTDGQSR